MATTNGQEAWSKKNNDIPIYGEGSRITMPRSRKNAAPKPALKPNQHEKKKSKPQPSPPSSLAESSSLLESEEEI